MTDDEATNKIARIYAALVRAEERHPNSAALAALHAHMGEGLEMLIADRPGIVRPYDGEPKPPQP